MPHSNYSNCHPTCIIGFTAAGEVLNCNTYDVGLAAAVGLEADKLFILHRDEVSKLDLPAWLPLSDAQSMLLERVEVGERCWCHVRGIGTGGEVRKGERASCSACCRRGSNKVWRNC